MLRPRTALASLAFASLILVLLAPPDAAGSEAETSWPGFRGPRGDGTLAGTGAFAGVENPAFELVWKVPIGSGYSGIAIEGDLVVTMFAEGGRDLLAAFDAATGERRWTYPFAETYTGHDGSHDGPIATPLVAGGRVFGLGPRGQLFALDAASGEELWATDLVADHGVRKPFYGFGSSPLFREGHLILQLGGEAGTLAAFDPASGEKRWSLGEDSVSYQTPLPWSFEGRAQLVAAGDAELFGVDPAAGELLWSWAHQGRGGRGASSMTPVAAGEGRLLLAHLNDASTAIELEREAGEVMVESLWEGRAIRNSYNVPVHHEGHLYAFSSRFLTAVDAATGESVWRSRQPGDGFLILLDGHLVIQTKAGGLHLAEASPEGYRELAGLELFDDLSWTNPSFAGGDFYLRSLGEMARVRVVSGGGDAAAARPPADSPFGRFLARLEAAPEAGRQALVDRFLAEQERFPLIEGATVHFLYSGPAEDVALAGDMFGARREEPMRRVPGTDLFHYHLELEPDARLSYLFLVDFEETRDPRNPRESSTLLLGKDMEMSFRGPALPMSWLAMPAWKAPAHLEPTEGETGSKLVPFEAESEMAQGPVGMQVYLPAGYEEEGERRYPVAYHHNGSQALERGSVAASLDRLVGTGVEPVIVVFLDLQARGPGYTQIFAEDIVPAVDAAFRTRAEREGRANAGAGFGGTNALMATFAYPDLFAAAAVQSPFLFSGLASGLGPLIDALGEEKPRVYLEWGTYDLRNPHEAWDMAAAGRRLAEDLRAADIATSGGEVADGSGWASWKNRTDRVFEALFPTAPE